MKRIIQSALYIIACVVSFSLTIVAVLGNMWGGVIFWGSFSALVLYSWDKAAKRLAVANK